MRRPLVDAEHKLRRVELTQTKATTTGKLYPMAVQGKEGRRRRRG